MDKDVLISCELAIDIMQNGFHLPIKNGKVNRDHIEDEIIIAMYKKELPPITDTQLEMAIDSVQELVNEYNNGIK